MALSKGELENDLKNEEISDIGSLMKILRICRIDREKMEAVESFIKHGGEELHYLAEKMHDIMNYFIFQASRRLLLSSLMKNFNNALELEEQREGDEDRSVRQRASYLEAAVEAADEEVRRLEYWSDVKEMAGRGDTKGAVDSGQGWRGKWEGLDRSGPKDVISDKKLMDVNGNGVRSSNSSVKSREGKENEKGNALQVEKTRAKGKEKAKD